MNYFVCVCVCVCVCVESFERLRLMDAGNVLRLGVGCCRPLRSTPSQGQVRVYLAIPKCVRLALFSTQIRRCLGSGRCQPLHRDASAATTKTHTHTHSAANSFSRFVSSSRRSFFFFFFFFCWPFGHVNFSTDVGVTVVRRSVAISLDGGRDVTRGRPGSGR